MCDPVTATALAMSAAGTYMETREKDKNAKRAQSAKEGVLTQNRVDQARFADESGAAFGRNVQSQGRENFDSQKQIQSDKMQQAFNTIRTQPDYNVGMPSSAPKNVVLAQQAANEKVDSETNRDVGNLSELEGYQGALFNQGLDGSAFSRLFGGIQDKAGGRARLLPGEMQAAATNSQKKGSIIPILLKTGGMALGAYGAGSGVTSFGDKLKEGAFTGMGPGAPVVDVGSGLFSKIKSIPGRLY